MNRTVFVFCFLFLSSFLTSLILSSCNSADKRNSNNEDPTIIYLVRHAEKAKDETDDPPLTQEGLDRAQRLAEVLSDKEIDFIFSSNFQRTQETAMPLATRLGKDIKSYDHKNFDSIIKFIKENPGANFLVVGHSNSTPTLINTLIGKKEWPKIDESIYTHIYTLIYKGMNSEVTLNTY
jgi:broad specificity phosphatase PhoE